MPISYERLENIKLVMFDLDGTLVDSVPDLAHAIDATLQKIGKPAAGLDKVRDWVGNGAAMLVKRALSGQMIPAELDEAEFMNAYQCFLQCYQQINGKKSILYPGVFKTLGELRSRYPHLTLITNKPEQFTHPLLEYHNIECFDRIICGDTLPNKKPHPEPLIHCLKKFDCSPSESLMVGDSLSDIKAAQAAKVRVACVSYGYNQGVDLKAYQPDFFIEKFSDLLVLL